MQIILHQTLQLVNDYVTTGKVPTEAGSVPSECLVVSLRKQYTKGKRWGFCFGLFFSLFFPLKILILYFMSFGVLPTCRFV